MSFSNSFDHNHYHDHDYDNSSAARIAQDDQVAELLDLLRTRHETVTTVESMTAGMISSRLADIPGSSDVLKRAFVTYCDEAKHEMVGVSEETLKTFTAVSSNTAREMAAGGCKTARADACVSVTGYAGPPYGPDDDTAGHVFIGCCYRGEVSVEEHRYSGSRNEVRSQAMNDALFLLLRCLKTVPNTGI